MRPRSRAPASNQAFSQFVQGDMSSSPLHRNGKDRFAGLGVWPLEHFNRLSRSYDECNLPHSSAWRNGAIVVISVSCAPSEGKFQTQLYLACRKDCIADLAEICVSKTSRRGSGIGEMWLIKNDEEIGHELDHSRALELGSLRE